MSNEPPNIDVLFTKAQRQVKAHLTSQKRANAQLFEALKHVFVLGKKLIKAEMVKDFVKKHDPTLWSKVAEKKPFHPLIQLVFGEANRSSQSQYSTVLNYCYDEDYHKTKLISRLKNVGLVELYKKAVQAKRAAELGAYGVTKSDHQIWAEQTVERRKPLYSTELTEKQKTALPLHNGYQQAYIEIVNGELRILNSVPITKEQQSNAILAMAGPPPNHVHQTLQCKEFYQFFVACDWITRFPTEKFKNNISKKASKNNEFTGIQLSKIDKGWLAKKVSEDQNFQSAAFEINDNLIGLDPKSTYFLTKENAQAFVSNFLAEGNWSFDEDRTGTFLRCLTDGKQFPLQTAKQANLKLLSIAQQRTQVAGFNLTKTKLIELKKWKNQHKAYNNKTPFVSLLQLATEGDLLILNLPNEPQVKKGIGHLTSSKNKNITLEDRYIHRDTVDALAQVAVDYDVDFNATLFTTFENVGGLCCAATVDGSPVSIFIPLVVSKNGNLAQICD